MSTMREWELAGGLDPQAEPVDDRDYCRACGDAFDGSELPTIIGEGDDSQPVHAQCAAICCGCSELGVAKDMLRIGAAHWVHYDCIASPQVIYEQARQTDEQKDAFNERRR